MPSQLKKDYVSTLQERVERNPNFCLVNFNNITHQGMETLRRALRSEKKDPNSAASLKVLKNPLFKVAMLQLGRRGKLLNESQAQQITDTDVLKGPSVLLSLSSDWLSGLQTLHRGVKEWEGVVFKTGLLDGKVYGKTDLEKLATLPSREVLVAKVLGSMKAPQSRTVVAMKYAMSKMVYLLKAKSQTN